MEIHGHILALQHDKKTLLASSQVSRIWRELVLPWLFFSFRVYVRSFSRLEDFIASVPHLAKYVQVVFVDGVHSNRPFHNAPAFLLAHDSPPLCTLLALPSLKELHCQFVCFETAQITVGASGVATVPHRLRRLVLDRCWARDWTSASSFLSICASLAADTLEISEPRLVQSAISRPQPSLSVYRLSYACRKATRGFTRTLSHARCSQSVAGTSISANTDSRLLGLDACHGSECAAAKRRSRPTTFRSQYIQHGHSRR